MKPYNISVVASLFTILPCFAQTPTPVNSPSSTDLISGVISATQSAVNDLRDELKRRSDNSNFNVSDYKAWNLEFRNQLDEATLVYTQEVDTEIVSKLSDLSKRYYEVDQNQTIDYNQKRSVDALVCQQLKMVSAPLAEIYQQAYRNLIKTVFGWLPQITVTRNEPQNGITAFFKENCNGGDEIYDLQVNRLDGAGNTLSVSGIDSCPWYPLPDLDNLYGDVANSLDESSNTKVSKLYSFAKDNIIIPELHSGCKSQMCLAMKAADLSFALETIKEKLDVPFVAVDGCVNIGNAQVADAFVDQTLKDPTLFNDPSLPFDTVQ